MLEPNTVAEDMPCELRKQVRRILKQKKFLLVLDKVPRMSEDDYEELQRAFEESDKGSKVLVTTSSPDGFLKYDYHVVLKPLEPNERWKVLQWQLRLSGVRCPPQSESDGQLIADNCSGLPIEIISTGRDLAKELQLIKEPSEKDQTILSLLGNISLPVYVPRFKIDPNVDCRTIYTTNRKCHFRRRCGGLFDAQLVHRNLVKIEEKNLNGSAKTCSITESTRKFCQRESTREGENILQEFRNERGEFYPPIDEVKKNRHVSIHDHISKFIPKFISSSKQEYSFQICLRSFVSHSKEVFTLHKDDISKIRVAFKLLRVLDAKPIKANKIHSDLCQLVHLRYINLSLNHGVLPESISKLEKVQTLIVHTTYRTLKIDGNILAMAELSHFETDASATLSKKSEASEKDERLQTLDGISPKSCTTEFFKKIPNLKKLGICGQLALLLHDDKNDLLNQLEGVKKLKLQNQEKTRQTKWNQFKGKTSQNHEAKLSSKILQFHPRLTRLTLSNTRLDWKDISNLGSLHELEELKLKDNAFSGKEWVVREDFPKLQTLKFESLDIELWKCSSARHFQKLKRLMLSKCEKLKEIPVELADISAFQELHLHNGDVSAKESAKCIREIKLLKRRTDNNIVFKLLPKDIFK